MSKAHIAAREPAEVTLDPGSYWWCACGLSRNQPFCDGSHKTTDLVPLQFEVKERKRLFLCRCKQSHTPPYCDGTHTKI